MEKLIRGGKVAILYSPGYGAGWSTWNSSYPDMVFCPELAKMVLDRKPPEEREKFAAKKWPDAYLGGLEGITIGWVPEGSLFRISEYDGSEAIETLENADFQEA